ACRRLRRPRRRRRLRPPDPAPARRLPPAQAHPAPLRPRPRPPPARAFPRRKVLRRQGRLHVRQAPHPRRAQPRHPRPLRDRHPLRPPRRHVTASRGLSPRPPSIPYFRPTRVRVVLGHGVDDPACVLAKILFKRLAVLADDESHHARRAILARTGHHGETSVIFPPTT